MRMIKIIKNSFGVVFFIVILSGCSPKTEEMMPADEGAKTGINGEIPAIESSDQESTKPESDGLFLGQTAADQVNRPGSKLCDWVDASDIIIKVNIAEGVAKDTSYETGFFFGPIYSNRRLARSGCDYRTGFSFEEMRGKGAAQVGVIGYSDNRRRTVQSDPISVFFDENGVPDINPYIEITITD